MKTRRNISTVCRDRLEAEEGSTGLRIAIERLFTKFEHAHKLRPGSARVLLPAGWGGFAR